MSPLSWTLVLYFSAMTVFLGLYMLIGHRRGATDLISIRNLALLGLIIFQTTSATFPLIHPVESDYLLVEPFATITTYAAWLTIFVGVLLFVYDRGWGVKKLAARVPVPRTAPGPAVLWAMAITLTLLAAALRVVPIPYVAALAKFLSVAFASIAAGIAGWLWAPRLFNPVVAVPAGLIILADAVLAQGGEFGRRPLVSVGAGMVWGMYWSHFRYLGLKGMAWRLGLVTAVPVIALSLLTSVRSWRTLEAGQMIQQARQKGDVAAGLTDLLSGQDCARRSMFVMEQFPERFNYRHLLVARYFFGFPVPRRVWPDKPWPLSTEVADMAARQGVKRGHTGVTVGPGIIGHAACDGGLYALVLYAIFGGLILRFFDQLVRLNVTNPIVVLPVGSSLGQVLGLARGETSVFMFIFIFATGLSFLVMVSLGKVLDTMMPARVTDEPEPAEDDGGGEEWAEYADHGAAAHAG